MSAIINDHRRTTKHVPEVDLMKALAIVSMVLIHVQMASPGLIIRNQAEGFLNDLINFFGCIPSAGVFMTALGWGAAFSVHSTPGTYMKRALHLVIPGIAVNFLTHYLPALLVPEVFGPLSEVLPAILAADVYFFAALSMLCLAALKKLSGEGKDRTAAVSAAALVVVCFALNILLGHENFTFGNVWLDTLLGLFIRENAWSYFPFISWIVYPMLGYGLAVLYRRARSQSQVLLFAGLTGAISILLSQLLLNRLGLEDSVLTNCTGCTDGAYHALHPVCALGGYGIMALEFVLASAVTALCRGKIPPFANFLSRNVMGIYILQFIPISLLAPLLVRTESIWVNTAAGILMLIVTCCGISVFNRLKKTK